MGFELVKNATQQFRTQVLTHLPEVAEATRKHFFSFYSGFFQALLSLVITF